MSAFASDGVAERLARAEHDAMASWRRSATREQRERLADVRAAAADRRAAHYRYIEVMRAAVAAGVPIAAVTIIESDPSVTVRA